MGRGRRREEEEGRKKKRRGKRGAMAEKGNRKIGSGEERVFLFPVVWTGFNPTDNEVGLRDTYIFRKVASMLCCYYYDTDYIIYYVYFFLSVFTSESTRTSTGHMRYGSIRTHIHLQQDLSIFLSRM